MAEDAFSLGENRKLFRLFRHLPAAVSGLLAVSVILGAVQWIGNPADRSGRTGLAEDAGEKAGMYLVNRLSEALEGILSLDRVYWISRKALAAPVPNPDAYASAEDPRELAQLPEKAAKLLDGQPLFFSPEIVPMAGTRVQYYLDDTILAITWKQVIDGGVYTFSEVKIAHPSQFRRFLAGGEFGSDKLFVTTEMAQSVNAVVASSGDFYSYRQAGTLVYDGTVRRVNNGLVDTCYIDQNGDLLFSRRYDDADAEQAQRFVDKNSVLFSLAFGPVLIEDGQVVTPDSYAVGEINDHYPRSALCQLGKLHYLLAVVNGEGNATFVPTIHSFARNLQSRGIQRAYALDGGQTAVIAMNGKLINAVLFGYQRRISDIIYFATAIPGKQEQEKQNEA